MRQRFFDAAFHRGGGYGRVATALHFLGFLDVPLFAVLRLACASQRLEMQLSNQEDVQVHDVGARRSGHDEIPGTFEKTIGIVVM
jgi:hypothetical protein